MIAKGRGFSLADPVYVLKIVTTERKLINSKKS